MFNLIATTRKGFETLAQGELRDLLVAIGDPEPTVEISRVAGLLTAKTSLDPFKAVAEIGELVKREPWRTGYLARLIPVEKVTETRVEKIADAAASLASRIPAEATYRVTVEKRHTNLSSMEVVKAVAERIERKVNLENPEWVVLIEIIGGLTGISVIRPEQILNLMKG